KASQAAREKILTPRLAPPETKTVPASSVPPSTLPTPSAASISPEEARFWGDLRARAEWWLAIYHQPFFTLGFRMMKPEEWRTDPVIHTPLITSENARAICQEDSDLRVKRFPNNFERSRASRETENHPLDDPALIQKGIWTIRDMDRLEGLFLDPRWNEEDGPSSTFIEKKWSPQHPLDSLIYLVLYRALQNGDTDKASTLVERYVRLYGTYYFQPDPHDSFRIEMMPTLERFLSWIASDPRVPEEILEWTATTLASWPLSPQEYSELSILNLNRSRENIVLALEERTLSHQHDEEESVWGKAFLRTMSVIDHQSFQVLQRTLDRKMTALIHQDTTEYRKAQTIQELALLGMGHSRDDTPITGSSGIFSSFDDFLMQDALAYDSRGTLIEKPGYLSTALFGELKESPSARPRNPSSEPPQSAFSSMKLEEVSPEFFNETIGQVRLAFAAARYRREHGRYPASVEEMIPRYLGETFKPNSERFWTLVRMEPLHTVVEQTPHDQKAVLEDPQTSASWSTAWWCVDPPSSFTQVLSAYRHDPRNEGRAPENIEDLKPYTKPDTDLAAFAPYFIQTDEYLLITRVLLKDPRQKAFYEFQKEIDAAQGKNDETLRPDTPFQSLYVSIPPWNPEESRKVPPPQTPSTPASNASPK
ncbi:MAG TPA: hypothetical protein PLA90_06090, partial [Candidatus Sumerlaeota bacterium]|nr:hypothetical protein [Candidatus Sumerlaeota bacterium]